MGGLGGLGGKPISVSFFFIPNKASLNANKISLILKTRIWSRSFVESLLVLGIVLGINRKRGHDRIATP